MIFALGLVALPAFVFLGFGGSSAAAGVGGADLFVSFNVGREPPGVANGVANGVLREGALGTPVLMFSLSLNDILKNL